MTSKTQIHIDPNTTGRCPNCYTSSLSRIQLVHLCGRMRLMTLFVRGALITKSYDRMLFQNPIMEVL